MTLTGRLSSSSPVVQTHSTLLVFCCETCNCAEHSRFLGPSVNSLQVNVQLSKRRISVLLGIGVGGADSLCCVALGWADGAGAGAGCCCGGVGWGDGRGGG